MTKPKFKVGDRVKVGNLSADVGENEVGLIGTIISIEDRVIYPICVTMDDDNNLYVYNEKHLKSLNSEIIKQRLGIK